MLGEGGTLHIAHWQSIKLVDKSEEEKGGKTVIRERAVLQGTHTGVLNRANRNPEVIPPLACVGLSLRTQAGE